MVGKLNRSRAGFHQLRWVGDGAVDAAIQLSAIQSFPAGGIHLAPQYATLKAFRSSSTFKRDVRVALPV